MKGTLIALLAAAALIAPAVAEQQPSAKPESTALHKQHKSMAPLQLTPSQRSALKKNGITHWVRPKPGKFIG
ncbi:MAG: hypothetical protein WCD20_21080 [Rhodomicrobium sp.]